MELAKRPIAPFAGIHAAVSSYVRKWSGADSGNGHNLATWRAHHATFTRLAEGDWGVAVPLYVAPAEVSDGEYAIDVHRRDGTIVSQVRVRPLFALERGEHGIEVCEIASRVETRRRPRRKRPEAASESRKEGRSP